MKFLKERYKRTLERRFKDKEYLVFDHEKGIINEDSGEIIIDLEIILSSGYVIKEDSKLNIDENDATDEEISGNIEKGDKSNEEIEVEEEKDGEYEDSFHKPTEEISNQGNPNEIKNPNDK